MHAVQQTASRSRWQAWLAGMHRPQAAVHFWRTLSTPNMPITTAGERSTRMPTAARQGGRESLSSVGWGWHAPACSLVPVPDAGCTGKHAGRPSVRSTGMAAQMHPHTPAALKCSSRCSPMSRVTPSLASAAARVSTASATSRYMSDTPVASSTRHTASGRSAATASNCSCSRAPCRQEWAGRAGVCTIAAHAHRRTLVPSSGQARQHPCTAAHPLTTLPRAQAAAGRAP